MFALPENLNIHNAKEVQEQLLNYFEQLSAEEQQEAVLDFAALRDFDAAGLQLLMAVYKTCTNAGMQLKLSGMTPFVQQLLELSGSSDILVKGGSSSP